jgi:hypothetical protein
MFLSTAIGVRDYTFVVCTFFLGEGGFCVLITGLFRRTICNTVYSRRPSRTPIGLGRSAPGFGGSGPCLVKVEQNFHFAFLLDKWICFQICFY